MADFLDIPALRAADEAAFRKQAAAHFAGSPHAQSIVLAVGQYFADEAPDAVHTIGVIYPSRDPWWPHVCQWGEPPADLSRCWACAAGKLESFGTLDSNEDGVYAYSAFCAEYGGGEGETEFHDPVLIARREPNGEVSVERIGHLARPFADFPGAFAEREDMEEPPLPDRPEPTPKPWTPEEAAMIERLYAAPDDDGLRRVLVDHWLEKGDPRGEFGALSFDGKAGTADRAWLGPLTAVVGYAGAEFGRGPFARHVTAFIDEETREGRPEHHREWATVESLRFAEGSMQLFSDQMRGMRHVYGLNAEGVRSLAQSGLTKIHTLGMKLNDDRPPALAAALAACFGLKELKTLVLEDVPAAHPMADLLAALPASVERIECWLIGEHGWEAGTAAPMLDALLAQKPGRAVSVGHQDASGARRGLIATGRTGTTQVELSTRGLSRPGDLSFAKKQLARYTLGALSPQVTAAPEQVVPSAARPNPVPYVPPAPFTTLREGAKTTSTAGWVVIGATLMALLALLIMKLMLR